MFHLFTLLFIWHTNTSLDLLQAVTSLTSPLHPSGLFNCTKSVHKVPRHQCRLTEAPSTGRIQYIFNHQHKKFVAQWCFVFLSSNMEDFISVNSKVGLHQFICLNKSVRITMRIPKKVLQSLTWWKYVRGVYEGISINLIPP